MRRTPRRTIQRTAFATAAVLAVALTVPSFMMAFALIAESDLVAAMPRRLASAFAPRFGLGMAELPLHSGASSICAVIMKAAVMDAGIAWLFDAVAEGAR